MGWGFPTNTYDFFKFITKSLVFFHFFKLNRVRKWKASIRKWFMLALHSFTSDIFVCLNDWIPGCKVLLFYSFWNTFHVRFFDFQEVQTLLEGRKNKSYQINWMSSLNFIPHLQFLLRSLLLVQCFNAWYFYLFIYTFVLIP